MEFTKASSNACDVNCIENTDLFRGIEYLEYASMKITEIFDRIFHLDMFVLNQIPMDKFCKYFAILNTKTL